MASKYDYRIRKSDGTILNAGTDEHSWFTIEQARAKVNRAEGDIILHCNGGDILGEAF